MDVSYSYDGNQLAVRDIDLDISGQGVTALVGPNGSGKTTLGKLAAGVLKPSVGKVEIDGSDTRDMSLGEIGSEIGYLFQQPDRQLFAPTVAEELSFLPRMQGADGDDLAGRVDRMLRQFDLEHLRDSFPFILSRGEKQRLALAAVLMNSPGFVVLDEPTTALDVRRKAKLVSLLEQLLQQGVGMLIISHDRRFVDRLATRVVRLSGGEISGEGRQLQAGI